MVGDTVAFEYQLLSYILNINQNIMKKLLTAILLAIIVATPAQALIIDGERQPDPEINIKMLREYGCMVQSYEPRTCICITDDIREGWQASVNHYAMDGWYRIKIRPSKSDRILKMRIWHEMQHIIQYQLFDFTENVPNSLFRS